VIVPCALCGARDTRRLYTKFGYGIERCRRCGLVYANPRAPESRVLERYNRDYFWNEYLPAAGAPDGRIDLDFIDGRSGPLLDFTRRHAPGGRRLLEVGTGAGLFLKAAERAGWEVAGVELSSEGAAFARERLGLEVREEPAEAMTFDAGSFDVAVMSEVIEHLFDPRVVLDAIHRALKPGGVIVITTPNFAAVSRYALGAGWSVINPLEHMYYFTETTLGRMLEASGFEIMGSRPILPVQTTYVMNPNATHAPASWRARRYRSLVDHHETIIEKYHFNMTLWCQMHGRADTLVMAGRRRA
jgi:2-polyprenyl-3-methyl-5-hydroxy-6-metoxy-1,4-benzoquinol methylase